VYARHFGEPTAVEAEAHRRAMEYFNRACDYERERERKPGEPMPMPTPVPAAPSEEARLREALDDAHLILAMTADRLNVALRESGCPQIVGDHIRSLAIRDGVVTLYDRGAQWRRERDEARSKLELLSCQERAPVAHADFVEGIKLARQHFERALGLIGGLTEEPR
jgi:hypothetical protein